MFWLMSLNADVFLQARGDKRLSLIQMILLTHLKAEFEKRANCRFDCDGQCLDTLGINIVLLC